MYEPLNQTEAEVNRRETYIKVYCKIVPAILDKYPYFKEEFKENGIGRMYHLMSIYSVFCNMMDVHYSTIMTKCLINPKDELSGLCYRGAVGLLYSAKIFANSPADITDAFCKTFEDKRSQSIGRGAYNVTFPLLKDKVSFNDDKKYSTKNKVYIDRQEDNVIYRHLTITDLSIFCNLTAKMLVDEEFFQQIMRDMYYLFTNTAIPRYILNLYEDGKQIQYVTANLRRVGYN